MTDDRIFYGPHPCANCGKVIVKASHTQGGESFDNPDGPIYPNTQWQRHDCGEMTERGKARAWQEIEDISAMRNPGAFPPNPPQGTPVSPETAA